MVSFGCQLSPRRCARAERRSASDAVSSKFRRDSRLLTVTNDTGGTRLTRYFLWDAESGVLKLIASLGSAVEEPCTAPR